MIKHTPVCQKEPVQLLYVCQVQLINLSPPAQGKHLFYVYIGTLKPPCPTPPIYGPARKTRKHKIFKNLNSDQHVELKKTSISVSRWLNEVNLQCKVALQNKTI